MLKKYKLTLILLLLVIIIVCNYYFIIVNRTILNIQQRDIESQYAIKYYECINLKMFSERACDLYPFYSLIVNFEIKDIKETLKLENELHLLDKNRYNENDYSQLVYLFTFKDSIQQNVAVQRCDIIYNFINLTEAKEYCGFYL